MRDSLHCGVDYGRFDYRRMIESFDLSEDEGTWEIALDYGGLHTFEALILARYQMNTQVYYHRVRRLTDRYLQDCFEGVDLEDLDLVAGDPDGLPPAFFRLTDSAILHRLRSGTWPGSKAGQGSAERIKTRKFHKVVKDLFPDAGHSAGKKMAEKMADLKVGHPDVDFLLDASGRVKIHSQCTRWDQDPGLLHLKLVGQNRDPEDVGLVSPVVASVPRAFSGVRIYADADEARCKAIRNWAK
ncbi:MAG: hypothetical protein IT350_03020 [Deltaproteobacteria bacterium]|nr:hypothetical protein [Deltaproteobacteria bacterium]